MKNETKISMVQCFRVIIHLIALLVIIAAMIFEPAGGGAYLIVVAGTLCLWFLADVLSDLYLQLLYARE